MRTARIGKEAVVRIPNRMGALAHVAKIVADNGINIKAVVATVDGTKADIRLVTADHQRTMDVLKEYHLEPLETRMVIIEMANKPGVLRQITEKLKAEELDLSYLYATTTSDAQQCTIVFASNNNDRAVVALNQ